MYIVYSAVLYWVRCLHVYYLQVFLAEATGLPGHGSKTMEVAVKQLRRECGCVMLWLVEA